METTFGEVTTVAGECFRLDLLNYNELTLEPLCRVADCCEGSVHVRGGFFAACGVTIGNYQQMDGHCVFFTADTLLAAK